MLGVLRLTTAEPAAHEPLIDLVRSRANTALATAGEPGRLVRRQRGKDDVAQLPLGSRSAAAGVAVSNLLHVFALATNRSGSPGMAGRRARSGVWLVGVLPVHTTSPGLSRVMEPGGGV